MGYGRTVRSGCGLARCAACCSAISGEKASQPAILKNRPTILIVIVPSYHGVHASKRPKVAVPPMRQERPSAMNTRAPQCFQAILWGVGSNRSDLMLGKFRLGKYAQRPLCASPSCLLSGSYSIPETGPGLHALSVWICAQAPLEPPARTRLSPLLSDCLVWSPFKDCFAQRAIP